LDKTIITAFMVMAGVISAVFVFKAIYPAIVESGDAMVSMEGRVSERLRGQIEIIHATGNSSSNAFVWVKNVGSSSIAGIERCDVFFGPEGNFSRVPHKDEAEGGLYWEGEIENDTEWNPTATLRITVVTGGPVLSGRYFVKVVTPNGLSDDYYFSE
jgi:archaellum component FlaF (FlaF/FlaG flagellin family)